MTTTSPLSTTKTGPALVTATFTMFGCFSATLEVRGDQSIGAITTIVLETGYHYDLAGDETSSKIAVSDGETMSIMVRCEGRIVGCGLFEVSVESTEALGVLLVPRALHNLIVDQNEAIPVEAYADARAAEIEAAGDSALLEVR